MVFNWMFKTSLNIDVKGGFTLDGVQLDVQNKFEHRCQRDAL